ncbi:MAG TPA: hypothetical protein DCZ94_21565 [Lentisphaeria bacterium]|nr:MAG: hypothetical protein A2X48_14495 [Lentisphaerae bacterium GWF2_49_21]HBC89534.1 hypothetical protein [Lentisphaeria bacterium]
MQIASFSNFLIVGQAEEQLVTLYSIYRSFLFFDTSSITNNAIINSATLSLYGERDQSDTDFNIAIQNGQPTYPADTIALADYNYLNCQYSSNGGQLTSSGWNTAGYNDIPLNSNGLLWINKTGTTKLCLRSSRDIAGTTPTANTNEYVTFWAQQKGTIYRPYLTVNYTAISALPSASTIKG